ncbi:MAG: hypothetical protein LBH73_07065 [Spirochaetaceae bacterium]|jgi:hypothetical protein|nr:hypothetical protein [Spirochaetaceae bacterium]
MMSGPPVRLRFITSLSAFLVTAFLTGGQASAQDRRLEDMLPALTRRTIVFTISPGIEEQNHEVVWNETISRVTLPGRPVSIKIMGQNIVVEVLFTPYVGRRGEKLLTAQSQVWIEIPDEGVRYQTTMRTMSFEFNEKILFFPLGSERNDQNARIVIQLELNPYAEQDIPPDAAVDEEGEGQEQAASGRPRGEAGQ